MKKQYALLKILLGIFLLYLALPVLGVSANSMANLFWGLWLIFFVLVVGANLAVLLNVQRQRPQENLNYEKMRQMKN